MRQVLVRIAIEGILVALGVVLGRTIAWFIIALCTVVLIVDGIYRVGGLSFIEARRLRSVGQEFVNIAVSMLEDPTLEVSRDSRELLSSDQPSMLARFNTGAVPRLASLARRLVKQEVVDHAESKAITAFVGDIDSYVRRVQELLTLGRQLGASEPRQVRLKKGETPSIATTVARMAALKERLEAEGPESDPEGGNK
jgi:hypothetical protein